MSDERDLKRAAYQAAYYKANRDKLRSKNDKWVKANPDLVRAYKDKWRKTNRKKMAAYSRDWYLKNRDRRRAYEKANHNMIRIRRNAYRKTNPDLRKAYYKAYRDKNRDRVRAKEKAYREKNRAKLQVYLKAYNEANRDKRREREIKTKYGICLEQWNKVFDIQGRKCAICKTSEFGQKGPQTDHCGIGGHFRGILCTPCNSAIGLLRHSVLILASAQEYLSKETLFNGIKAA